MKQGKALSLVEVLIATILVALLLTFFGQLTTFFQGMKQRLSGIWQEIPEIGFLEIQRRLRTLDIENGPLSFDEKNQTLSFSYIPIGNQAESRSVTLYADSGIFYLLETIDQHNLQKTALWHDTKPPTFTFLGFDTQKKPACWCEKTELQGPFAPKVLRISSTSYTFDFELPVFLQPNEILSLHLTPTGNACNSSP